MRKTKKEATYDYVSRFDKKEKSEKIFYKILSLMFLFGFDSRIDISVIVLMWMN